jgi:hypothetical protein
MKRLRAPRTSRRPENLARLVEDAATDVNARELLAAPRPQRLRAFAAGISMAQLARPPSLYCGTRRLAEDTVRGCCLRLVVLRRGRC